MCQLVFRLSGLAGLMVEPAVDKRATPGGNAIEAETHAEISIKSRFIIYASTYVLRLRVSIKCHQPEGMLYDEAYALNRNPSHVLIYI